MFKHLSHDLLTQIKSDNFKIVYFLLTYSFPSDLYYIKNKQIALVSYIP